MDTGSFLLAVIEQIYTAGAGREADAQPYTSYLNASHK